MARPTKTGLEYFPFDVDFFNDEKISAITGEFGCKGEIIAIKLLCTIYRNGYFALWNELLKMNLLKQLPGVSLELLEQVVSRLIRWGFFDETLFNSDKVLTSNGIQKRFIEATKRRKDAPELIYCVHDVYNNRVNAYNNPISTVVNADINTQSKVKESKVNKNILSTIVESPPPAKDNAEIFKLKKDHTAKKAWEELIQNLPEDSKEKKPALGDYIRQYRPDFIEPYATLWNLFASENKLRQVEHLTEKRKKKIKLRAAEPAFDFVAMLIEIKKSSFARGDNSRGWRVDFDFLIESESNYVKILEGKFEN